MAKKRQRKPNTTVKRRGARRHGLTYDGGYRGPAASAVVVTVLDDSDDGC